MKKEAKPVTVPWVADTRSRNEPLVMMTAYDFSQARLVDNAGVDITLVGDSLAMVMLGYEARAVGCRHALWFVSSWQ